MGGALAGALEASRPPEHISNALHESVTNPGSIVHPMTGVLKTEKDEQEQALDELESAVLREVSLLQVTERRADGALENPDVNAVLGMGAIGEQRETQLTVKSQSAVCPDAQCPRSKVVNLGYIAKGCARPASAALHTARRTQRTLRESRIHDSVPCHAQVQPPLRQPESEGLGHRSWLYELRRLRHIQAHLQLEGGGWKRQGPEADRGRALRGADRLGRGLGARLLTLVFVGDRLDRAGLSRYAEALDELQCGH